MCIEDFVFRSDRNTMVERLNKARDQHITEVSTEGEALNDITSKVINVD